MIWYVPFSVESLFTSIEIALQVSTKISEKERQ